MSVPLEKEEADQLMQYCRTRGLKFTHIKNETGRAVGSRSGKVKNWQAIWDKRDGVSKGFPDFAVITRNWRGQSSVVFIELKRIAGSKVSPEQREWVAALADAGIPAAVAYGALAAIRFIEQVEAGTWKRAPLDRMKPLVRDKKPNEEPF